MKSFGRFFTVGLLLLIVHVATANAESLDGFLLSQANTREVTMQSISQFGSLAAIDLGGDGIDELVAGAGEGEDPEVFLLRADGSVIKRWLAYEKAFRGGVQVAVADLDSDGKSEIIATPGEGGGPHVRVFDGTGVAKFEWFAFGKDNKYGINAVSALQERGAKPVVLVTGWEDEQFIGKFFDPPVSGHMHGEAILLPSFTPGTYVRMFAFDLGTDGRQELVMVGQEGHVFKLVLARLDGSVINEWTLDGLANINALTLDRAQRRLEWVNQDGVLVTQDLFGKILEEKKLLMSVAPSFVTLTYGAFAAGGEDFQPLVVLHQRNHLASRGNGKYIEISLTHQRLRYYEKGFLIDEYVVSTGKPGSPTPAGTFKIEHKADKAWSRTAGLFMPQWMAFVPSGKYGIHRLPYWPNGHVEGEISLGRKVSGGCVRVGIEEAKKLYEWADIGTPVYIN